ncbi:MAG: class I SAM-dependent methyltransferase [Alphaproteobacteria bacterium]|nr:class I SAM-dependent methyltransferase [Alphaproteobacteria bacterium]
MRAVRERNLDPGERAVNTWLRRGLSALRDAAGGFGGRRPGGGSAGRDGAVPGRFRARSGYRPLTPQEQSTVDAFLALYFRRWQNGDDTIALSWLGHQTLKCPSDLWIYQELLTEHRPDIIIETGTCFGGSALFLASICDLLGCGEVITIDSDPGAGLQRPRHRRIRYVTGSSTAKDTVDAVRALAANRRGMVILDSDHGRDHVLAEMRLYQGFVAPGCYMIVEDSCVNGHPILPDHGPGPWEAVEDFLRDSQDFAIDRDRERLLLTLNPRGYLRRTG